MKSTINIQPTKTTYWDKLLEICNLLPKASLRFVYPVLASVLLIACLGCSGSGASNNPLIPSMDDINSTTELATGESEASILGVYDIQFDLDSETVALVESRQAEVHLDITAAASSYWTISGSTFDVATRIFEFDLTLDNPSTLDLYDVRAILDSAPGSGYELIDPDDYTDLFTGVINPFYAYAETVADRLFASGDSLTEHFAIYVPTVPSSASLIIECSFPNNCREPYWITDQNISNPVSSTTSGLIHVRVMDHQLNADVVTVDTTPITGGITNLTNIVGPIWEGSILNTAGAAPGVYTCLITAGSVFTPVDLYDYLEIQVLSLAAWKGTDIPIVGGCGMDLGVISDPGGSRDSKILMAQSNLATCDEVVIHDPLYTAYAAYVNLVGIDPGNPYFVPYPVLRIDAADDGAFSFTNRNWTDPYPALASATVNAQVWSVFDNTPYLHTAGSPDDGRYLFSGLTALGFTSYPVDVCDDFTLGQYALFTTEDTTSTRDLMVIGTMPAPYTHATIKYFASLDPWAGVGDALVNPNEIAGIDTLEIIYDGHNDNDNPDGEDFPTDRARIYILEESTSHWQVEVFDIFDTAPGMGLDAVNHIMTITINQPMEYDVDFIGEDIELLPINAAYERNMTEPTLVVLTSWTSGVIQNGEVLLYNATTGDFLESIGTATAPVFADAKVNYTDTDDADFDIHVTWRDASSTQMATIFDY